VSHDSGVISGHVIEDELTGRFRAPTGASEAVWPGQTVAELDIEAIIARGTERLGEEGISD
jgi:hypothetical protein